MLLGEACGSSRRGELRERVGSHAFCNHRTICELETTGWLIEELLLQERMGGGDTVPFGVGGVVGMPLNPK